jgi:glycolate oxidase
MIVGSEGTLGIITKAAFKIRPLPKARKTGFYIYDSFSSIQRIITKLRETGIVPNMMEFLDKTTTKVCFDYLGGEYAKYPNGYFLLLETDGTQMQVQEEFSNIDKIAQAESPKFSKLAQISSDRTDIISARKAALPALSRLAPTTSIEDCTINLSKLSEAIRKIEEIPTRLSPTNIQLATFGHLEGNLHPTFLFNENNPKDVEDFEKAMQILYEEIVLPLNGTVTGEHGIGLAKSPYMAQEHISATAIMHKLKQFFDPNQILNPGKGKGMASINYKNPRTVPEHIIKNGLNVSCMRCGFCLTACPGLKCFQKESFSPRGKLALIRGILRGNLTLTDRFRDILYACTLCGACASKCPAGILTNELFESVRQELMADEDNKSKSLLYSQSR